MANDNVSLKTVNKAGLRTKTCTEGNKYSLSIESVEVNYI